MLAHQSWLIPLVLPYHKISPVLPYMQISAVRCNVTVVMESCMLLYEVPLKSYFVASLGGIAQVLRVCFIRYCVSPPLLVVYCLKLVILSN